MGRKTVVIFSGAGLSKESGIPTFRDSISGLWENFKIEDVATPEGWKKDKKTVLDFYAARWNNVKEVEPNPAHYAIAKLEEKFKVVNVTQNIDDLLERAGCTDVWHLHGQINQRKCEKHTSVGFGCDYLTTHQKPVELEEMCPKCNSQLRPDVVWFNEPVGLDYEKIQALVDETDIFIGCGTSAQVYPAANFLYFFSGAKVKMFVDPVPPERLKSFLYFQGTAVEWLPKIVEELLDEK